MFSIAPLLLNYEALNYFPSLWAHALRRKHVPTP